jgi:hypothetical protein
MNTIIVIALIIGAVYSVAAFTGVTKSLSSGFQTDPAAGAYNSKEMNDKQSERIKETEEKNRRFMERVQAQMDKAKR